MDNVTQRVENRNSSFELLRIVAMLFIIAQHLLLFVVYTPKEHNTIQVWYINSFLYIGANVFILISGYFGINPKFKTFINLYLCIAFYKCICYFIDVETEAIEFSLREFIANTVFCISHSNNWFIAGYIFLFLLSPVLNIAIKYFDKKMLLYVLVLLTISNLYFGYFWKLEIFNLNGYNGHQFIYLYFIGRYINKYIDNTWIKTHKLYFLLAYIVFSVLYFLLFFIDEKIKIPHWDVWKYNNPLLIVSTISFVLFFCGLNIKSRVINFVSLFSFPAFLIHIFPSSLYPFLRGVIACNSDIYEWGVIFTCAMVIYLITIPIELIRLQLQKYVFVVYDKIYLRLKNEQG